MKITYIHHSCFLVETDHYQLIFDYFKGVLPALDKNKKTVFFVSHNHRDHFNPLIFSLVNNASFVVASDIQVYSSERAISLGANVQTDFEGLRIETLESTDEGVAFIVQCDGKLIFHAGDLNWWHWDPENEQEIEDNKTMAEQYRKEIDKIKDRVFDVAFIPLDPRLEYAASWGMKYFLECVNVNRVYPMHMWQQLYKIKDYLNHELKEYKGIIQIIKEECEEFEQ